MTKILIALITILALALTAGADIEYEMTFENYDLNAKNFVDTNNPLKWKASVNGSKNYYQIVSSPVRAGNKAMKFYNQYVSSTDTGFRTENTIWSKTGAYELVIGNEYWIGWSIYLPADFVCDGCEKPNSNWQIHGQIHGMPDRGKNKRPGKPNEELRNPHLFLEIRESNWYFHIVSDADPVTIKKNYDRNVKYDMGSWSDDAGKWTDWVLNFKLDYTKKGENGGFVKLYKNGSLVVNDTGGNCFNDLRGPYFTFGTYKFGWGKGLPDTNTRTVYFDEIRIGDNNSNFNEVSPIDVSQTPGAELSAPNDLRPRNKPKK